MSDPPPHCLAQGFQPLAIQYLHSFFSLHGSLDTIPASEYNRAMNQYTFDVVARQVRKIKDVEARRAAYQMMTGQFAGTFSQEGAFEASEPFDAERFRRKCHVWRTGKAGGVE